MSIVWRNSSILTIVRDTSDIVSGWDSGTDGYEFVVGIITMYGNKDRGVGIRGRNTR